MSMNVYTHMIVGQKISRSVMSESMLNMMDDSEEIELTGGYKLRFFSDDYHYDCPIVGVSLAEAHPYADAVDKEISGEEIENLRFAVSDYVQKQLKYTPDVRLFIIGFWW